MKKLLFSLAAGLCVMVMHAQQLRNPIIPGFHPDHLSPAGPVPLPVSEGGHVRQRLLPTGLCYLATNSRQTVAGGGLGQSIGGAKGGLTGPLELTSSYLC